jgi:hypothetical protein
MQLVYQFTYTVSPLTENCHALALLQESEPLSR